MTKEESILISAYTGYFLTKDWSDVHALCEKVLGRPIFSHEFAAEEVHAEIREKLRPMLAELRFDDQHTKHGYWREWRGDTATRKGGYKRIRYYSCSECECCSAVKSNYCPRCGARMDECAVGV